VADREPRMRLKTITSGLSGSFGAPQPPARVGLGATLGATRMNNLGMLRTYVDNRER
jgi:hypothetical protein